MPRVARTLGLLAVVLLALWGLAPERAAAPAQASTSRVLSVGMADDKPDFFTAPRFLELGITKVRRVVPWDSLSVSFETPLVDDWIRGALTAGLQPLISFGHSRRPGMRRVAPTPAQLLTQFKKFRARYPSVTDYAVWNEPNLCGEPLCHKPELAARYYDALVSACPTACTILASEVLDGPTMTSWVTAFMKKVRHTPKVWGLHNYVDANRMKTSGTKKLLGLVKGQIWFTETGGIVKRRSAHKLGGFPETIAHAADALRWIFDDLVPLSTRIRRVYLYHWNPATTHDSWDSALVDVHGKPRPGWYVVQARLKRLGLLRPPVVTNP